MQFGVVGQLGPGMRQLVGFGDRSTGKVILGVNMGCTRVGFWGFLFPDFYYRISYCVAASMLLGHFLELCGAWASVNCAGLVRGVASKRSNAAFLPHHSGQTCLVLFLFFSE